MGFVIIAGLILGLGSNFHCIGMCGPIAMAVPVNRKNNLTILSGTLQYNLGRVLTYALLGLIVGSIGLSINTLGLLQWISIIAGIFLIVFAWRKYLQHLLPMVKLNLSMHSFTNKYLGKLIRSKSPFKLSLLGMLNGLLPCGMVYVALGNALLGGDMLSGALAMAAFGVGTLPGMMAVTFMANKLSLQVRRRMNKAVPYILTIVGVMVVLRGMNLGIPFVSPNVNMAKVINQETGEEEETVTMSCCHSKSECEE